MRTAAIRNWATLVAAVLLASQAGQAGLIHTTATLSQAREGLAGTSVGGKALFAGGDTRSVYSDRVDIYDASAGTWSTASLSQARGYLPGTSVGNNALFAGGSGSNRVDIYDALGGTWSTASLSQARGYMAGTSVGNKALIAGGWTGSAFSSRVDIYDAVGGTWTTASLSQARHQLAGTSVGNKALFAGGMTTGYVTSDRVDIYDALGGTWTVASLSQARDTLAGTSVGGKALFAGGSTGYAFCDRVDIYDASAGTWTTASLSQARYALAGASVGDLALFAGGWSGSASNRVDIYDAPTGTWYTASLSQARHSLAGTSVGNKAIFAGGWTGSASSNVVDIFELTDSCTWTRPAASGAGAWGDAANWDSVIPPLSTDKVYITNGGTAVISGTVRVLSLRIGGGSTLTMELGGTTLGAQYGHITAAGGFTFGGTLHVAAIAGFTPAEGDTFDLFDGSMARQFESLVLPELGEGLTWDTSQLYTTGEISVVTLDTTPPVITVPADITVEQASTAGTVVTWPDPTASDDCDPNPTVACDPPSGTLFGPGENTVTVTASDASGNTSTATFKVTVVDTTPPILIAPADVTAEQTGSDGTPVRIGQAIATDACDPNPVITNDAPAVFPLGITVVTWTATDASHNSATATQNVTVVDTTPPVIESAWATPGVLWSPNHKMVPVTVDAVITDLCVPAATFRIVGVTCNEPVIAPGSGKTSPDWQITGDHTLLLRSERAGTRTDRIYTITIEAVDASGNPATATAIVTVPHDQGKK